MVFGPNFVPSPGCYQTLWQLSADELKHAQFIFYHFAQCTVDIWRMRKGVIFNTHYQYILCIKYIVSDYGPMF